LTLVSQTGAELVREARTVNAAQTVPRLNGLGLHAAEAEMHAHAGRADECRRSLDMAVAVLPAGTESRDPDMLEHLPERESLIAVARKLPSP